MSSISGFGGLGPGPTQRDFGRDATGKPTGSDPPGGGNGDALPYVEFPALAALGLDLRTHKALVRATGQGHPSTCRSGGTTWTMSKSKASSDWGRPGRVGGRWSGSGTRGDLWPRRETGRRSESVAGSHDGRLVP